MRANVLTQAHIIDLQLKPIGDFRARIERGRSSSTLFRLASALGHTFMEKRVNPGNGLTIKIRCWYARLCSSRRHGASHSASSQLKQRLACQGSDLRRRRSAPACLHRSGKKRGIRQEEGTRRLVKDRKKRAVPSAPTWTRSSSAPRAARRPACGSRYPPPPARSARLRGVRRANQAPANARCRLRSAPGVAARGWSGALRPGSHGGPAHAAGAAFALKRAEP